MTRRAIDRYRDIVRFVAKMNAQLTVEQVLDHADTLHDLTRRTDSPVTVKRTRPKPQQQTEES